VANNNTRIWHRIATHKGSWKSLGRHLIRNPAGIEVDEIQDLTKPNTISVNKLDLKTDKAVLKILKNLEDIERITRD